RYTRRARIDAARLVLAGQVGQRLVHNAGACQGRRDLGRLQDRLAHVHADALYLALFDLQVKRQDAAARFDRQPRLGGDAVVVDVLGHAADAVAAHLRFAAVGVEHAHAGVGALRRADEDQAVAADAEMAVADDPAQGGGI